jgi:hypothetical protein
MTLNVITTQTITADQAPASGAAISYGAAGIAVTIDTDVLVFSHDNVGVVSSQSGSKLINNGYILGGGFDGVAFNGANSSITNNAGHTIAGLFDAIALDGDGATVVNHGVLTGLNNFSSGISVSTSGDHIVIVNDGDIFGRGEGIFMESDLSGGSIDNSGTIRSDGSALSIGNDSTDPTIITNRAGATISGGTLGIYTELDGHFSLDNRGTLIGGIDCTSASAQRDEVINAGKIKGNVHLGEGDDLFKNAGGTARKVYGGEGNDKLIAGSHIDKFVFDTTLDAATNVDRVKHFTPGTDKLFLDQTFFPALSGPGTLTSAEFHTGAHAHDADDYIIYNKNTGALYYDQDGNANGFAKVEFAHLDAGLSLSANDFTVIA